MQAPHPSLKGPALHSLDYKVSTTRHQGTVPVGAASLGPALVQAGVKPETKLALTSTDKKTVNVTSCKMLVFPRPVEYSELWFASEEEALSCPVEVLVQLDGAGEEGTKHVLLGVLDAEEGRTAGLQAALPVQAGQAEAVQGGGEDETPASTNNTRWQGITQPLNVLRSQDLRLSINLRKTVQVQTELLPLVSQRLAGADH